MMTQMLCLTLMFLLQPANDQSMLILVESVLGIQAIEDQTIRGILALAAGPVESPHSFHLKYCEWYSKPRQDFQFREIMLNMWSDDDFKANFRMSKGHFADLTTKLTPHLAGRRKDALPVPMKVAVGVRRLSKSMFTGSTASKVFRQFLRAVILVRNIYAHTLAWHIP